MYRNTYFLILNLKQQFVKIGIPSVYSIMIDEKRELGLFLLLLNVPTHHVPEIAYLKADLD